MTTITKYALVLGAAAFLAPLSKGELMDFHFGAVTQTGAAAVGTAGDLWNGANLTNGGPVLLKDTAGSATSVSVTWTSGDAWGVTGPVYNNTGSTGMDSATNWMMRSFLASYSYKPGATNLTLTLTGLAHSQAYTLVLYGAGDQKGEGTIFTVSGASTYTGTTTGTDRKITNGPGDAYVVMSVVSSPTGTLKLTAAKNSYPYAVLNGFQLQVGQASSNSGTTTTSTGTTSTGTTTTGTKTTGTTTTGTTTTGSTPVGTTPPSTPPGSSSTGSSTHTPMIWGICGHPTWSDYASWVPANVSTQMSTINQLGASYYRVSFEGNYYPGYLTTLVPKAQAAGVTLLPVLPISLVAADSAQTNYSNNYTIGYNWAAYAISKGYNLPYWELGNEVENWNLVNVVYDGASPNDFPDKHPGGFVAIASGMDGAYDGIKDAYAAGRKAGETTITPKVLIGMCFRHWGLLAKIQAYNDGTLPCDVISWHWYGPNYGAFNGVINDPKSVANGRTPAACLGDFKSNTDLTQPMDVWITETDRSQAITGGGLLNGSVAANAAPATSQDWAAQAFAIQTNIDSFKTVPSVKAIFVYELFDETIADKTTTSLLASQGYFGLVTGLNGTLKNAFYTYQAEIKAGR